MRLLSFATIVDAVQKLCIDAASQLPPDVLAALEAVRDAEELPRAESLLAQCLENARLAAAGNDPIGSIFPFRPSGAW